jgi:hypothetical protein
MCDTLSLSFYSLPYSLVLSAVQLVFSAKRTPNYHSCTVSSYDSWNHQLGSYTQCLYYEMFWNKATGTRCGPGSGTCSKGRSPNTSQHHFLSAEPRRNNTCSLNSSACSSSSCATCDSSSATYAYIWDQPKASKSTKISFAWAENKRLTFN